MAQRFRSLSHTGRGGGGKGDPVWQQSRAPTGSGISARRDRQGTDERGQKRHDEVVTAEADNEAALASERRGGRLTGRQGSLRASSENEKRAGSGGV